MLETQFIPKGEHEFLMMLGQPLIRADKGSNGWNKLKGMRGQVTQKTSSNIYQNL